MIINRIPLISAIQFNPKESLIKKNSYKKVPMEMLKERQRKILGFQYSKFNGGAKFRNGDTLLARITPCLENGKTAYVDILEDNEVAFGSTEFIVLRKTYLTDSKFIYYLATSDFFRKKAISLMEGTSGRKRVNTEALQQFEYDFPDIKTQSEIANFLSLFDEKIEINFKINYELENLAKTIYDYWFVQFDFPDENGKPYKSSGGEMVWNEELKKEIPKDWKVDKLNSFVKINSGYPFKSSTYVAYGKYKIITIKNVQDKSLDSDKTDKIDVIPKNMSSICKLDIGDFLMSLTGNVGRTCLVDEENLLLNQRVGKINTEETDRYFIYCLFNSSEYKNYITKIAGGSSQANLSPIEAVNFNITKPENKTLTDFNSIIKPLIDKIILNNIENKKLIELRDFLLPLLMNGQVTIE